MFPKDSQILIVDDMTTMRMSIKKDLLALGYEQTSEAVNGAQAWDKINLMASNGTPFALILSDWNMPKMNGVQLLKKIRQMPKIKDTPFIMITAEAEKDQVMQAAAAKVNDYLVKPFSQRDLEEKLRVLWEHLQKKVA